jgi:nitrite reductase (NADH) large subunit
VTDPQTRRRFQHFVNSREHDSNVEFVPERGQIRPARPEEKRRRIPAHVTTE